MVWIVRRRSVWLKPHVSILSIPILEDKIDKLTLLLIMLVVSVLDRRYQRPMNSSSAHLSTHAVYKISVHTWTTLRTTACCFGCTEKLITYLLRHCLKIIDPVTNMYPDPGNGLHSRECLCSRCLRMGVIYDMSVIYSQTQRVSRRRSNLIHRLCQNE